MKSIKILLLLACSVLATAAFASDDYVDLGYAGHSSKFYNQTYHLKLSKELSDEVVGTLEYNTTYADWRDPGEHEELTTHSFLLDIYKLIPLNDNVQAFVGVGYNNSSSKFNCIAGCVNTSYTNQKPKGSAFEGTLGLRYQTEHGLTLSGQLTKISDTSGTYWSTTNSSYEVDLSYPVLDALTLGLRHRSYEGRGSQLDFTSAYLRYLY
jgi:opacity protein-like surface antigen